MEHGQPPPSRGFHFDPSQISSPPRAGDLCPQCGQARLDYDAVLNLACPVCGFALAGCHT